MVALPILARTSTSLILGPPDLSKPLLEINVSQAEIFKNVGWRQVKVLGPIDFYAKYIV